MPGEVISEDYVLEYGKDWLQMHVEAVEPKARTLVVDDLIATGGTLCAAMDLLERAGAEVVECDCMIELPDLKGHERLKDKPLYYFWRRIDLPQGEPCRSRDGQNTIERTY